VLSLQWAGMLVVHRPSLDFVAGFCFKISLTSLASFSSTEIRSKVGSSGFGVGRSFGVGAGTG